MFFFKYQCKQCEKTLNLTLYFLVSLTIITTGFRRIGSTVSVPTSTADNIDYFGSDFEDDDGDWPFLLAPKIDDFLCQAKYDHTDDFALSDAVKSRNK